MRGAHERVALGPGPARARPRRLATRANVFDRPCVVEPARARARRRCWSAHRWTLGRLGARRGAASSASADRGRRRSTLARRGAHLHRAAAAGMAGAWGPALARVAGGGLPMSVASAPNLRRCAALAASAAQLDPCWFAIHAFYRRLLAGTRSRPDFPDSRSRGRRACARLPATWWRPRWGRLRGSRIRICSRSLEGFGPPELETALAAMLASGIAPSALGRSPWGHVDPRLARQRRRRSESFSAGRGRAPGETARGSWHAHQHSWRSRADGRIWWPPVRGWGRSRPGRCIAQSGPPTQRPAPRLGSRKFGALERKSLDAGAGGVSRRAACDPERDGFSRSPRARPRDARLLRRERMRARGEVRTGLSCAERAICCAIIRACARVRWRRARSAPHRRVRTPTACSASSCAGSRSTGPQPGPGLFLVGVDDRSTAGAK
jgi:hypothetical protein